MMKLDDEKIRYFFAADNMTFICFRYALNSLLGIKYIEDIYFFEVNTKYISSNVLKISVILRVRSTSEIADSFNS